MCAFGIVSRQWVAIQHFGFSCEATLVHVWACVSVGRIAVRWVVDAVAHRLGNGPGSHAQISVTVIVAYALTGGLLDDGCVYQGLARYYELLL